MATDFKNKFILLVEDDPDLRSLVESALSLEGFDVIECENGAEALKFLLNNKEPPSLIILDLMMPKMNGLELLKELSDKGGELASLPVLVMSAASDHLISQSQQYTQACLRKPFSIEELVCEVEKLL